MDHRLVFVPCELPPGDSGRTVIEDADGWPTDVFGRPVGWVWGRLCVAGRWLRAANGRHLVRFADGSEAWVVQGPGRPEEFTPLEWEDALSDG